MTSIKNSLLIMLICSCAYLNNELQKAKSALQPAFDIIKQCVDDKPGVLQIGDVYYMCSIYPLGEIK